MATVVRQGRANDRCGENERTHISWWIGIQCIETRGLEVPTELLSVVFVARRTSESGQATAIGLFGNEITMEVNHRTAETEEFLIS